MSCNRIALLATLLLSAGPACTAALADVGAEPIYREELDDPPAAMRARDDLFSRSPRMTVGAGSYVSTQVNVDLLGLNIVGDAANEPSIAVNPTDPENLVVG